MMMKWKGFGGIQWWTDRGINPEFARGTEENHDNH
jgi:hypothetical protein